MPSGWETSLTVQSTDRSDQPPATVESLTERELIARIQRRLPAAPAWMLVGIGDDAAVVEPERNRVEVLTVDALVDGVHVDRAFVPPDAIGYRALAVNLSDMAAMGASPRTALLSLAMPGGFPVGDFDRLVDGLTRLAAEHRLHVAGGNITRTVGPLILDVTLIGTVKRRQALLRSGARPGDELYVSGAVGSAGAGLQALQTGARRPLHPPSSSLEPCIQRYLYPEPRVRLGVLLSRNRAASACVDLSDGLSDGVQRIAESSGVGMTIDLDALPIEAGARAWFEQRGLDAAIEASGAGDDYELLIAVRPRTSRRLRQVIDQSGVPLTRIGACTKERAIVFSRTVDGQRVARELPQAGYRHFR